MFKGFLYRVLTGLEKDHKQFEKVTKNAGGGKMFRYVVWVMMISVWALVGCERNPNDALDGLKSKSSKGAFIINEGNWGHNNGTLSYYDFATHQVQNSIFRKANGRDLGDTPQSMAIYDTLGFIVVNTSNKIEVIGLNSWKSVATISMPANSSPRNIAFYDGKAYVTDLMTHSVSIISLSDYKVIGTINVGPNPEEIIINGDKAFVANSGFGYSNTVSVIDLKPGFLLKNLKVGDNPAYMIQDDGGYIHVLCGGRWPAWGDSTDKGTDGSLYVIDPAGEQVVDSLALPGHPSELTYDGNESAFFIYGGHIVSYSTQSHKLVNDSLISGYYYSLEADPVGKKLFVLDAKDYTQNGELKIFDFKGILQETHVVGITPGAVTFVYDQK